MIAEQNVPRNTVPCKSNCYKESISKDVTSEQSWATSVESRRSLTNSRNVPIKLIIILFRLWKMWQRQRDIITTKLLKGVKYFKYIITCGFHDCSVKFYNFKVVMRWERRNRCGRCQNTVIFNVRLSVYRRYMHTSQYRFRIFTFEDFL